MIHQQPPPKPLLPQHMICHLTKIFPVTETGPDAARGGAGGVPRPPGFPGHGDRPGRRPRRRRGRVLCACLWAILCRGRNAGSAPGRDIFKE